MAAGATRTLILVLLAGVPTAVAAMPADAEIAFSPNVERAGMVCNLEGCRMQSDDAVPNRPFYGRSYLGGDDEKRALAERDRLRKERQQQGTGDGDRR